MSQERRIATAAVGLTALFALGAVPARSQTNATIFADTRNMTGGVRSLDRAQFFNYHGTLVPPSNTNLGNLVVETWSADGLNVAPGRHSTDLDSFIAKDLPQDPNRPGYIRPSAAVAKIQGDYRNFVLRSPRWEPLRNGENPIFVQNGRNGGFWPDYLDSGTQMPTNYEAYAEYLNIYLEEVVYGPNAFLPLPQERFYLEIMNEPQWTSTPWNEVIDLHRVVTERVKERFPSVRIGGTSSGDKFQGTGANTWSDMKMLIDDMVSWQTPSGQTAEFDYWAIHNYERYDVAADGSYEQAVHHSPGHVAAILDLFENYSHNTLGDPKQFAITEYGSWNRTNMADGSYGSYPRDLQQWDLVRDVREQLLVYMDRPDRIINATPFVSPRHWEQGVPTNAAGDNVFWEQDAGGSWVETIVAETFRMYSDVRGEYVPIDLGNPDLQAVAFREGSTLRVLLNNLREGPQQVDLSALGADVGAATWTRTFRDNGQNHYRPNVDITDGWQSLTLEGEAGAVLTLNLEGPEVYHRVRDSRTFYGADTQLPIATQAFVSTTIEADVTDAVSAKLRFGYSAPGETLPAFTVRVNGSSFTITADPLELDDNDFDLVMREIEVPVGLLNQGQNDISFFFPFSGASGEISAAVLEVTRSVGEYTGNARLDSGDLDTLYKRFGAVGAGEERFDLNTDGAIDTGDVDHWLELRNAASGDVDVDGDIDSRDAVAVIANRGAIAARPEWSRGNSDADADVDAADVATVLGGFSGDAGGATDGITLDGAEANPRLVYDPATGRLQVAPAGVEVLALSVTVDGVLTGSANFAELDAAAGGVGLHDRSDSQIGWVSGGAATGNGIAGFGLYDLGVVAPEGLEEAELGALLAAAVWAGDGIGGRFDLVLAADLPGDFNGDGEVTAADYTVYRDTLASTSDRRADADRDGRVGPEDYALWRANFGRILMPTLAVPEPTAIAFATGFWVAAAAFRRVES